MLRRCSAPSVSPAIVCRKKSVDLLFRSFVLTVLTAPRKRSLIAANSLEGLRSPSGKTPPLDRREKREPLRGGPSGGPSSELALMDGGRVSAGDGDAASAGSTRPCEPIQRNVYRCVPEQPKQTCAGVWGGRRVTSIRELSHYLEIS
eukprot:scaffold48446_cov68-Phaeocystis_antarctica.AAC.4